ncbi:hypothetical protein [Streptomyces sp. HUAS TT7]|uniref:hypothetical protein n=1 Tax=Streptomyces sp. HUAS TT7 TaxID=3447507 RepID=UPI003F65B933
MRTSLFTSALVTVTVGLAAVGLVGCGQSGGDKQQATPSTSAASPSSPAAADRSAPPRTPTAQPSQPARPSKPAAPSKEPEGDKPTVTLSKDPEAAGRELSRLQKTGWYNPNKIEYSDDPVISLQQFKRWLDKGYIARSGGWTAKGEAAVQRANSTGGEL